MQKEIHEQVRSLTDTLAGRVDFVNGKIRLPDLNLTEELPKKSNRFTSQPVARPLMRAWLENI